MTDSRKLIAEYARSGSETSFEKLVTCYLNLVYSAALRAVGGDTHLAEDVTQTVFLHLARKAHQLPVQVMLGGWLHRATINVAATIRRSENRRKCRERKAVEMNALQDHTGDNLAQITPLLDEAIDKLNREDRTVILLRFFEQLNLQSLGEMLDITEDAARKRVSRALDKLHAFLKHRGVALSAATLGTALISDAVTAAPGGLAAAVAGTALAGAAGGGGALAFFNSIAMTKLKIAIIGAFIVACVATPLLQHQSQVELRAENRALRQKLDQLSSVAAENERISNLAAQVSGSRALAGSDLSELLRLRGEVGRLRETEKELGRTRQPEPRIVPDPGSAAPVPESGKSNPANFLYVSGEVLTPARFVWTNGITLASAIELAHGFTGFADRTVLRLTGPDGDSVTINYGELSSLPRDLLQPGAKVHIPRRAEGDSAIVGESADPIGR